MVSFAANPSSGTVTPSTTTDVTWTGTALGVPPAAGGEVDCVEGENCDTFKLTFSGTPADWVAAGKQVRIRIQWLLNASDYDLSVRKGSPDGPIIASSGAGATTSEEVVLNPSSPSIGTGDFYVRAIYFAVAPGDQYNGVASVIAAAAPPLPAVPATGVAPRYQVYTPPAAGAATLGIDAAEPSIGVNWLSETGTNGGRSMYIALLQTLRITFDDSCPSSPNALWENKSFAGTAAQTFDPILFTDHGTGRTMVSQLIFPAGSALSASATTDDDGENWVSSTGAGPGSGIDHQSIGGGGPFHAPLIPAPGAYPNAVYYCGQLPAATCALSLDGGMTYGPANPVDTGMECGGLHGHIKVGPEGTAYLPNKGCGGQAVIVSENNGATWDVRVVPGSAEGGSDSAVGIGRGDQTAGIGRVYLGYADGDNRAVIATSPDRGLTWSQPYDVGAIFGINNVAFPAVVAGDDDRAAFAFYGTPTEGGLQGARFQGVWHLYVAHTYDGGQTWFTVDVTPNDPMQRGCIWLGGGANICRNMLDFAGIDLDKRGRVLVGYNDGCAGAECAQAPAAATGNSYTALAAIARQTGGKSLFATEDSLFPDAPIAPGAPSVTALRNGSVVHLSWSTSNNGGSTVTGYTVSRTGGAPFAPVNVAGNVLRYDDGTATDTGVSYTYSVAATNVVGTSCGNNSVQARYQGNSNAGAGYVIYTDPNETGAQTANPDLDIEVLSIAEPSTGPNAGKLVFNLRVADLTSIPNNRMWRIFWDSPNSPDGACDADALPDGQFYVGMTKDAGGVVSYEYGTVSTEVVGLVVGLPRTCKAGNADVGGFTTEGLISIVVSKDKLANPRTGDLLGNFAVRTYNLVTDEVRSNNAIDAATNADANDLTANAATYQLVGPIPGLDSVVSRKTHDTAGVFDLNLALIGPAGVEPRNDGSNTHQVVFRFTQPVTFSNATVTPGSGATATVASTSPPAVASNEVVVNLANVSNAQRLIVNLTGVTLNGTSTALSASVGILHADVNADERVDAGDVLLVRQSNLQPLTEANFRRDVNASGRIDAGDVLVSRNQNLTGIPQANSTDRTTTTPTKKTRNK